MDGEISFRVIKMKAITATPENFRPFGQVVGPSPDGAPYGPEDAQLKLDAGIPRFYIINLKGGALRFNSITHHASVTQCLGSVGGHTWYVGVARSSIVEKNELASNTLDDLKKAIQDDNSLSVDESIKQHFHGKKVVHSKAAHYYVPPAPEDVQVFRVEGPQFLKLDIGTWHAGPLFKESSMDFYNLELSNTNVSFFSLHFLLFFSLLVPWMSPLKRNLTHRERERERERESLHIFALFNQHGLSTFYEQFNSVFVSE